MLTLRQLQKAGFPTRAFKFVMVAYTCDDIELDTIPEFIEYYNKWKYKMPDVGTQTRNKIDEIIKSLKIS